MNILELGVNQGGEHQQALARKFPEAKVIGVDIDHASLKRNHSHHLVLGDCTRIIPVPESSVDIALCYLPYGMLLLQLTQPESPLYQELSRVLTPGGKLDILVDAPNTNHHLVTLPNESVVKIDLPSVAVYSALKSHPGFSKVNTYRPSREELTAELWTGMVEEIITNRTWGNSKSDLYRIRGKKRTPITQKVS